MLLERLKWLKPRDLSDICVIFKDLSGTIVGCFSDYMDVAAFFSFDVELYVAM